jgi:hypothetical protein
MANEIDMYKDLEYCEKVLKRKDLCPITRKEWEKEKVKVIKKIKKNYPELAWSN